MEEAVTAADANRKFSLILRSVREGHSYVVTSHGRPVARIVPADKYENVASGARTALLSRLALRLIRLLILLVLVPLAACHRRGSKLVQVKRPELV